MIEKVTTLDGLEVTLEQLRARAAANYRGMQLSWYGFARDVAIISKTKAHLNYGYKTFKEFCLNEYQTLEYISIVKFVKIVQKFGKSIEDRLKKEPNLTLPAYQALYELAAAEKDLEPTAVTKLKQELLDKIISYRQMRDKVKILLKKKETGETAEEEGKEIAVFEAKIKEKKIEDDIYILSLDVLIEEAREMMAQVMSLKPLLSEILKKLEKGGVSDSTIKFGNDLELFVTRMNADVNDFLNSLEEI